MPGPEPVLIVVGAIDTGIRLLLAQMAQRLEILMEVEDEQK